MNEQLVKNMIHQLTQKNQHEFQDLLAADVQDLISNHSCFKGNKIGIVHALYMLKHQYTQELKSLLPYQGKGNSELAQIAQFAHMVPVFMKKVLAEDALEEIHGSSVFSEIYESNMYYANVCKYLELNQQQEISEGYFLKFTQGHIDSEYQREKFVYLYVDQVATAEEVLAIACKYLNYPLSMIGHLVELNHLPSETEKFVYSRISDEITVIHMESPKAEKVA